MKISLFAIMFFFTQALAQENIKVVENPSPIPSKSRSYDMAVNLNLIGAFEGYVGVNTEYSPIPSHGILGELSIAKEDEYSSFSGLIAYRYYFGIPFNSIFFGPFLRYAQHYNERIRQELDKDKGVTEENQLTYVFDSTISTLGLSLGYRWVFEYFTLCLRFGWGPNHAAYDWHGEKPDDPFLIDIHSFLLGFDGELSIGYAFNLF